MKNEVRKENKKYIKGNDKQEKQTHASPRKDAIPKMCGLLLLLHYSNPG